MVVGRQAGDCPFASCPARPPGRAASARWGVLDILHNAFWLNIHMTRPGNLIHNGLPYKNKVVQVKVTGVKLADVVLHWSLCVLKYQTLAQDRQRDQDNKNNTGSIKQCEPLTASRSSYSKFPQCEHPKQQGDKRASVLPRLKATSQHSRLQQAQIWQPTGSSCHSRAHSIPPLSSRLAPSLTALSPAPVGSRLYAGLQKSNWCPLQKYQHETHGCPWLLE